MGNDGGTTATRRDCLTKKKKQPKKISAQNAALLSWTSCRLSNEAFSSKDAIVACKLGFLFKKESLIQILLDKTKKKQLLLDSPFFSHIHSLKDVCDVKFTPNPEYNPENGDTPAKTALFICPITQKPISGIHKFCLFRSCGHVISEEALKNMNVSQNQKNEENSKNAEISDQDSKCCLVCGTKNPLITLLNPPKEEIEKIKNELIAKGEIGTNGIKEKKRKLEDDGSKDESSKKKRRKAAEDPVEKKNEDEAEFSKKHEEQKQKSAVYSSLFN